MLQFLFDFLSDNNEKKYNMSTKFYDIHCHAMNLSHPNLLAFINRFKIDLTRVFSFSSIHSGSHTSSINRLANLISIMENDLGDYFLIWEYFLKNDPSLFKNEKLIIDGQPYDKIVLTPLIVDYGSNKLATKFNIFYNVPPQKPIITQVVDIFSGIKKYLRFDIKLVQLDDEMKIEYSPAQKDKKLFEIYPFLGINTANYSINKITNLLTKHFDTYSNIADVNKNATFFEKMGTFPSNIYSKSEDFNFYFSGIKLYPPVGFDPFPINDQKEFEKVDFLYKFCSQNNIPITTHCSDGGFVTVKNNMELTNPARWEYVLIRYPNLKLNFAHFGWESRIFSGKKWRAKIIELILKYQNVYTDFSAIAIEDKYYKILNQLLSNNPDKLKHRILYGSDYMINLTDVASYNEYLTFFANTMHISSFDKHLFCNSNPEKFLFNN